MRRKQFFSISALVLAATTHIATSQSVPDGFEEEIQEQVLQGLINDVDWIFGSGVAIYDSTNDEYLVRLYAEQVADPCNLQSDVNKILAGIPNQVGPYSLSLGGRTVTFIESRDGDSPMNFIAIEGEVEVYSVGPDTLEAGLAVFANDSTWANGTFTVTICE